MNNHHYDAATRCVANKGAAMQATETTKEAMVSKLVAAWEDKNAKRAAQGAGLSLMALSLAACGGSDAPVVDPTPVDPTPVGPTALEVALGSAATVDMGDLGEVTDLLVTVAGSTPGADTQAVTLAAIGSGTITFDFADADDTVVLDAASSISGFTALEVVAGTVDVTAVDISGITSIDIASGIVMDATQFIAFSIAGSITSATTGLVEVVITTAAEAEAVIAVASTVTGGAFNFVASPDSVLTAQQLLDLNGLLDQAIIDNTANDVLPAKFAALATAVGAEIVAGEAVDAYLLALGDTDGSGAIDGTETGVFGADVSAAYDEAAEALDGLGTADQGNITGAAFNALTAAQQTAIINAEIATFQSAINVAQSNLDAAEAEFDAAGLTNGVANASAAIRSAVDAYELADTAATEAADAVTAAEGVVTETATAATALLDNDALGTAAFEALAVASGVVVLDDTDGSETSIALTAIDPDTGVAAIIADVVTLTNGVYSFEGENGVTYTITASYLDALVAAQNALVVATAASTAADAALTTAIGNMEAAFEDGGVTLGTADANNNNILDSVDTALSVMNGLVTDVTDAETALSDYNTAVADWQAAGDVLDDYTLLADALTDAGADVTAAAADITDSIANGGLGLTIITESSNALAFGTSGVDSVAVLTDTLATVSNFGHGGTTDRLFIGTDYTVVEIAADATTADNLGNLSVLEVFVQEYDTGNNGTIDGVKLYFETETFGGNGAGADNLQQVDIAGVTLADLTFLDNGILVGEIAVA